MPSTPWQSARRVRAPLLLAALALAFVVPLSAAHVACDHADDPTTGQHQCTICRHLDDSSPFLTAPPSTTGPAPVADLFQHQHPAATARPVPTAHGRSPPAHDPVS